MYSNDKGFGLKDLIIKIIFFALFVILLIWLYRTNIPNMKSFYSNVFRENISYMQGAAKGYFTSDKLPTKIDETTKLTLKQMQELKLIIPFVDKDGNSCNIYESYAEVTKEENGYTLKIFLDCNSEKDYIVEILGCYDYGCDTCEADKKQTAIEYQFVKNYSKEITEWNCPSGYKRDGKVCYKTVGTEKIAATKNYTNAYTVSMGVLYTVGANQKVEVNSICNTINTQEKVYIPTLKREKTIGDCVTVEIPDPSCTVQCVTKFVDGEYVTICNECGTVPRQDCSGVTKITEYYCPSDADGSTGSGENLKCYKLTNKSVTTCKCPEGTAIVTGSGTNIRCYNIIPGAKTPYCENKEAEYDEKTNKCILTVGGKFSHYSCPSGYTRDEDICLKSIIDKVDATSKTYTKKWSKTKWSRSKTLWGWTFTGKTRIVEL